MIKVIIYLMLIHIYYINSDLLGISAITELDAPTFVTSIKTFEYLLS
jgi:hypothetical protein